MYRMDGSPAQGNGLSDKLLSGGDEEQPHAAEAPIVPTPATTTGSSFPEEQFHGGGGDLIVDALQSGHGLRGEQQQPGVFRDLPFAIAFLLHVIIVFLLAFGWGIGSLSKEVTYESNNGSGSYNNNNTDYKPDYHSSDAAATVNQSGILWLCLFTSLASLGISALALELMTRHAEQLIQMSLFASMALLTLLVIVLFGNGAEGIGFLWLFILILTGLYAYSVWHRIPFAAANLATGLEAITTNSGVCMIAYAVAFCGNLWVMVWALAVVGVNFKEATCSADTPGVCQDSMNSISFCLLLFSYYWTSQVLKVRDDMCVLCVQYSYNKHERYYICLSVLSTCVCVSLAPRLLLCSSIHNNRTCFM
jgi:hypothetical protein